MTRVTLLSAANGGAPASGRVRDSSRRAPLAAATTSTAAAAADAAADAAAANAIASNDALLATVSRFLATAGKVTGAVAAGAVAHDRV